MIIQKGICLQNEIGSNAQADKSIRYYLCTRGGQLKSIKSRDILAEQSEKNWETIRYYICLIELIQETLEIVDYKMIFMLLAVEFLICRKRNSRYCKIP